MLPTESAKHVEVLSLFKIQWTNLSYSQKLKK